MEKTLESPLDCKEIQSVLRSLSNSGWVSIWSAEPAMLTNYAWPWAPPARVQPQLIQGIQRRDGIGDLFI